MSPTPPPDQIASPPYRPRKKYLASAANVKGAMEACNRDQPSARIEIVVPPAAMNVSEFCAWACIGRTKMYAEAKAGRLILRKIGTKTVILRSDAEGWLRSLPTASAASAA
jgi:hypothetical protein